MTKPKTLTEAYALRAIKQDEIHALKRQLATANANLKLLQEFIKEKEKQEAKVAEALARYGVKS